ncbi:MAG: protein kinase [candidate division Zixibacteria bacterium]|nr:protein kinase [candidate division Zixibacteria bacterium]NIR65254.1 protein kinase [candidate division Zixibacteria bacterium]NIS14916.1 protein kinase [candidate division Zixibacteria bacterium]NIS46998.1 protein kinase [candidate division Zixibacteria bacterium]NIT51435.1 protein kinase [candidate division Zixibacteria bacterium]
MGADERNDGFTRPYKVLVSGSIVKNYKIISKIGRGGMGEVYLAEDTDLNRMTALKFLLPHICQDESCRSRFKREAQASARLDHSNIATIFEVDEYDGRPFFAMQYIEGLPLNEYFKDDKISFDELIDISCRICEGLYSAHKSGIIHRDIKPSNIIIDKNGHPKIFDFGLAAIQGTEKLTEPGSVLGTIGYMSPEQLQLRKVDHRTDLFSLGVLMYEIITGRSPFKGDNRAAVMNSIINDNPEPLSRYKNGVPEGLEQIVFKLLQKDPGLRYQGANEVISDLKLLQVMKDRSLSGLKTVKIRRPGIFGRPLTGYILSLIIVVLIALPLISPSLWDSIFGSLGIYGVPSKKHLAVLPFAGLEKEESVSTLNDGLLEILTAKLSQMEAFHGKLQVIPASEIRQNNINSARQARQAFGATLAVTGSMHTINDSIQLIVNLIDARRERQLRSAAIKYPEEKISALQDSTLFELARMLEIQLRPEEKSFLSEGGTESPEAYYYYLEGMGRMKEIGDPEKLDSVIILFNQAIRTDNDFALAYCWLGKAYWNKYRFVKDSAWLESAENNVRRAIELNPDISKPHVILGEIYNEFRETDKAITEFENALNIDSTDNSAYKGLAQAHELKNDIHAAESIYKKAVKTKPYYPEAYFDLAWFYISRARMRDAEMTTQKIIDLKPEGFTDWNNIGALYFYMGKYQKAQETWEHSLIIKPNYGAYSNLGALYFTKSQFEKAARMYEEALRLNDSDYRVWMNLAGLYQRLGSDAEADSVAYMKAIQMAEAQKRVNPKDPEILSHLAEAYSVMNMHNKAIEHIEKALSLSPSNVNYYVSAGLVYELADMRADAIQWVKKALENGVPTQRIENIPEFDSLRTEPEIEKYFTAAENEDK